MPPTTAPTKPRLSSTMESPLPSFVSSGNFSSSIPSLQQWKDCAALFVGTFLGVLSDLIGQAKFCLIFCILHLFVGIWKRVTSHPSVLVASTCLSLTSSIFSFSFETWMVVQHEKQGHRQDSMSDTFWLMTFFESASFIGSQVLANWLRIDRNYTNNFIYGV
nr:hypothetical protein CFP56_24776 [Quercus suber]